MSGWEVFGSARVSQGDCIEVLREFEADSIDTIICDPPYGLFDGTPGHLGALSTHGGFLGTHGDQSFPGVKFGNYILDFLAGTQYAVGSKLGGMILCRMWR